MQSGHPKKRATLLSCQLPPLRAEGSKKNSLKKHLLNMPRSRKSVEKSKIMLAQKTQFCITWSLKTADCSKVKIMQKSAKAFLTLKMLLGIHKGKVCKSGT